MAKPDVTQVRSVRFLLGSLLVLVALSLFLLQPFLSGTLFALVLGYLMQGPYRRMARWVRSRGLAAGLLTFLVVLVICLPLVLVTWQIVNEVRGALEAGDGAYDAQLEGALASLGLPPDTASDLIERARANAAAYVQENAFDTLSKVTRVLANVGVFLFVLFFVFRSGDDLADILRRAVPLEPARRDRLLAQVGLRVHALFLGTFLVAAIQGVVATVGWWLLGFPSPLFWGFVMTMLAVIPAVGPAIVMVPAGLIAIVQGDTVQGIILIIFGLVVVSLLDNLVRPYVVGRSSNVHPALVLLGTLGGLAVFGITGFILGPLILSMVGPVFDEWERTRLESAA